MGANDIQAMEFEDEAADGLEELESAVLPDSIKVELTSIITMDLSQESDDVHMNIDSSDTLIYYFHAISLEVIHMILI